MQNNKNTILAIACLVAIVGLYLMGTMKSEAPVQTVTLSTTTETAHLPATTGTKAKPATAPTKTPPPISAVTDNYVRIGQTVSLNGVSITPEKVTYDSRCPKDVQCIQAGTVELGVELKSGSVSQNVIITLGKEFYFDGTMVTLTSVTPAKLSTKTLQPSDYRFLFNVKI